MGQFEQLVKEREKVQQDQRPLMDESDRLRLQLSEFSEKRSSISVSMHETLERTRLTSHVGSSQRGGYRADAGG